jgi:hypothetical protein
LLSIPHAALRRTNRPNELFRERRIVLHGIIQCNYFATSERPLAPTFPSVCPDSSEKPLVAPAVVPVGPKVLPKSPEWAFTYLVNDFPATAHHSDFVDETRGTVSAPAAISGSALLN